ncbi:MAG: DUF952 domain-containing protein [Chloroflexi bacterium]|nr:DUF952 domain-containing protein [Chloroflexota bacterium]
MTLIYHITSRNAAQAARQSGEYRADSLASEGFIHFSQLHQLLGVANAFYTSQTDLVILLVDPALVSAELKYEAPVHPGTVSRSVLPSADQRFPHLYGPLNFTAVVSVVDLPHTAGASFELPDLL